MKDDCLITADASKVSPAEFFEAIFGPRETEEQRKARHAATWEATLAEGRRIFAEREARLAAMSKGTLDHVGK